MGSALPVAMSGLRQVLAALGAASARSPAARGAKSAPEWDVLFPGRSPAGRSLFGLADAPNQRRLFRESEQTFRVLNVAAHALVDGLRELQRPLVLRNVGACDLVSVRGFMHAVQCSRLDDVDGTLVLCDWSASSRHASRAFSETRTAHMHQAARRMRARLEEGPPAGIVDTAAGDASIEHRYLAAAVDPRGSAEHRLAAALLAIRACFFSTGYEGAMLAAETGLAVLAAHGPLDASRLVTAWESLDDPRYDIPMLELDRSHLGNADQVRALLLLHVGVLEVFTGRFHRGLAAFGEALACRTTPEVRADLHLYRGLVTSKMLGDPPAARLEIDDGLAALEGRPRAISATHAAWLYNLRALTHFQEKDLGAAMHAEERSLSLVDHAPGPSAAHLKTNLVSNFSVLYEARGDITMARNIWQCFAPLNEKLGSDAADKVYLNRLGALQREAGDTDAALACYRGAFGKAEGTGDAFHAETIASAIARAHIDRAAPGDRQQAAEWYQTAAARARSCGDALQVAKALAGAAIATGSTDFSSALHVLACDSAYERESVSLRAALRSGDAAAVLGELPRSKSKLSRPFNLVNL